MIRCGEDKIKKKHAYYMKNKKKIFSGNRGSDKLEFHSITEPWNDATNHGIRGWLLEPHGLAV